MKLTRGWIAASAAVAILAAGVGVGIAATPSSSPSRAAEPRRDCLSVTDTIVVDSVQVVHLSCAGTTVPDTVAPTDTAEVTTSTLNPTTTVAPTTTVSPTTTIPPTTSTGSPATSTTSAGTTSTTAPSSGPGCGLSQAAFCETFDQPASNASGKTGDLDSVIWGVSRVGNENPGQSMNDMSNIKTDGPCADTAFHAIAASPAAKSSDVKICAGRMYDTLNDGGSVVSLNTYPKQPFDWAGRTGKVVFDVSSDSQGTHAAWPEFVITDKPVPGFRADIASNPTPTARNEVGFALTDCDGALGTKTTVDHIFVSRNYAYEDVATTRDGCVNRGDLTHLNHIEVRLSTSSIEIWGTDPGSSTLVKLGHADNLGLTFTKGLVWLNDVHYNARKALSCECGTQWNHTFAWDNLGFDGPKTYRDLGYNVPDANVSGASSPDGDDTTRTGYQIGPFGPTTFTLTIPAPPQTPTGALLVFNWWSQADGVPAVKVNGTTLTVPASPVPQSGGWVKQTIDIPIPLAQLHLGAANTLAFSAISGATDLSNVSVILVAGAPVP